MRNFVRFKQFAPWLLALFLCVDCAAQTGRGGITGLVTDSSGAVVPGVSVEILNAATNISQNTQTNSAGLYLFTALVPGTYRLTATFVGFQKAVQESIPVEVDRVSSINIQLVPGEVSQAMTVLGEAVLAKTTDSTIE